MTNITRKFDIRCLASPGIWLGVAAMGCGWVGMRLGDLAQRARHAGDILSAAAPTSGRSASETRLISDSMLETARELSRLRAGFVTLGLCAAALIVVLKWASFTVRVVTALVVFVALVLLMLDRNIY
jgi:hypothetical protein